MASVRPVSKTKMSTSQSRHTSGHSRHSGLRPSTRLNPPTVQDSEVHHPTPSPQPKPDFMDKDNLVSCPDDQSMLSIEPSSMVFGPVITPCPDYSRLGLWMSQTFPHHFTVKDVFFINQILKIRTLDDLEVFLTLQPSDLIAKLGQTVYNQWLPTIINCMTCWTILAGVKDSIPFSEFLEQREALHEMVRQTFSEVQLQPPKYTHVSPLAQQYGVTSSLPSSHKPKSQSSGYIPSEPRMVDSLGQPFITPTEPFQGGMDMEINQAKENVTYGHNKRKDTSVHHWEWEGNGTAGSVSSRFRKPRSNKSDGHSSHSKGDSDRHFRGLPAKARTKFEKISWNGMHTSFRPFRRAVEGHLLQVGAGYLASNEFVEAYKILGEEYLKTDKFWNTYKVSYPQALYDTRYLYGILVTATKDMQHKIILKYEANQDGILAWDEFKKDFAHDGSEDLKIEQLEAQVHQPYSAREPGGMAAYIDKFQAYIAELETMIPADYTNARKKRLLLTNI